MGITEIVTDYDSRDLPARITDAVDVYPSAPIVSSSKFSTCHAKGPRPRHQRATTTHPASQNSKRFCSAMPATTVPPQSLYQPHPPPDANSANRPLRVSGLHDCAADRPVSAAGAAVGWAQKRAAACGRSPRLAKIQVGASTTRPGTDIPHVGDRGAPSDPSRRSHCAGCFILAVVHGWRRPR